MQCVAVCCSVLQLHPLSELSPVVRSISPAFARAIVQKGAWEREKSLRHFNFSPFIGHTRCLAPRTHSIYIHPFLCLLLHFSPSRSRALSTSFLFPSPSHSLFFSLAPSLARSHTRTLSLCLFSFARPVSRTRPSLSLMLCALAVTLPLLFFCLSLTPSFSHSCYPLMRARTLLLFDLAAARLLTHLCAVFSAHYHTHLFLTLTRIYTYFTGALFSLCLPDFSRSQREKSVRQRDPFSCAGVFFPPRASSQTCVACVYECRSLVNIVGVFVCAAVGVLWCVCAWCVCV